MGSATADPFARFSSPMSAHQPSEHHPHQKQQRYLTPPFSPQTSSNNVPTVDKATFQQGHAAHMSLPPHALFSQITPAQHQSDQQQGTGPSRIPIFQGRSPPQFHMPMPIGSAPLSPPANADDDNNNRMLAAPPPLPHHAYSNETGPPAASAGAASQKRATYNPPTSTSIVRSNSHQPSMFSREQVLSPEYTLHPSIAAYQLSHPRRQLINFGPYILLQTLGEGEFGKVKLGVHREYGEEVAIKLIRRGSVDNAVRLSKVEREIDVLKTVKHPNIVRLFDVIETEKYIGIILDFANGGELFDHILAHRYLKEKDASKLFAQLISGVQYLHSKKIVHRDLKLENLLLDKHRNVIITDFGFANRFEHRKDDLMATSCGSPCYAAPELVVSDGLYVGSAVDIWSCGVILYAMLSGYLPFDDDPENPEGDNINLLYKYIINTPLTFPDWISPTARDLMQSMLVPNPEQRFTLAQVMNHPWLEPFRPLFSRSVDELEMIAQEQMQHKRQASRRDMQARMKAREAARINHLAQTAGVLPGQPQQSSQAAGMQDHQRRHKSDMPMGYGMAPSPLVTSQLRAIAASPESTVTEQRNNAPPHSTPPIITSGLQSTPRQAVSTPTAPLSGGFSGSEPAESRIQSTERTRMEEDAKDDPVALEAEARASARIRADAGPRPGLRQHPDVVAKQQGRDTAGASTSNSRSVPLGSNRHTIQVEYDGDAAYDRLLEIQAERRKAFENEKGQGDRMVVDAVMSGSNASPVTLAPTVPVTQARVDPSRAPMLSESRSQTDSADQMDVDSPAAESVPRTATAPHGESHEQQQSIPVPSSPVMSPSVIRLVPPTPVKDPLSANATPRPPQLEALQTVLPLFAEDQAEKEASSDRSHLPVPTRLASTSTYSSSGSDPQTPRLDAASARPYVKISTQSRQPSVSSTASLAADLAPSPSVSVGSNASGNTQSVSGKKDRPRKGLSMNSFGFSKLLSGGNTSTDSIPTAGGRGQGGKEAGTFLSRGGSIREKAKKRAEQKKEERPAPQSATVSTAPQNLHPEPLRTSRTPSPDNSTTMLRDGSARSRNSLVIVQADKILPPHPAERSASNVSITQFDTFRNGERPQPTPVAPARPQPTASSSAAQKVMNWFRRKSVVKGPFVPPLPISREPSRLSTAQVNPNAKAPPVPSPPPHSLTAAPSVPRENKENASPAAPLAPQSQDQIPDKTADTTIHSPQPRRSGVSDQTLLNKLPRPATVGRDLVKQTEPIAPPAAVNPITSSPFNEARLRVHVGVVDQSALTSKSAVDVMDQVQKVLYDMGIEVKRETEFKLRCLRVRRKKVGAMTGLGLSSFGNSSIASMAALTTASSGSVDRRGLPLPNSPSGLLSAPGGFRSMLMRRGSSQTGNSGSIGSPELGSILDSPMGSPRDGTVSVGVPEPMYGEHSVDPGDEVRFSIELTRLKNLPGLLSLDIKRLRGNVWSFKFVYQTILERCELTH